jgi:predicted transcriptional regulator
MADSAKKQKKSLTEAELEVMSILWKLNEGTAQDVLREVSKFKKLAYTSVSTVLRVLEQKKIVGSRKEGRWHIYFPKISKSEHRIAVIEKVIAKVFDGAPMTLIQQLVNMKNLSSEDLKELKKFFVEKTK